jgi:hypothetical protein
VLELLILGSAVLLSSFALGVGRQAVIRTVTSRSLGGLAPGYAATEIGFLVYVNILMSIGLVLMAIWSMSFSAWGIVFLALAVLGFIVYSIVAIAGEVRTYRALKR